MYSVRLGHTVAIRRLEKLVRNGHHAEALVTSVFTIEKVFRRTLKELIISAGFTSKSASTLIKKFDGFSKISDVWSCFDPEEQALPEILGNNHWQHIPQAVKKRNKLVHGAQAFNLEECEQSAVQLIETLKHIESVFQARYGYSGWKNNSVRRVSKLHSEPKVHCQLSRR